MILLLSRQDDGSTKDAAEWLFAMKKKFVRLNADDYKSCFLRCDVQSGNFSIMINDKAHRFSSESIKSVWHRRQGFSKGNFKYIPDSLDNLFHGTSPFAKCHLREEATELNDYLYYLLESNPTIHNIGSQSHNTVNKLKVLKIATSFLALTIGT